MSQYGLLIPDLAAPKYRTLQVFILLQCLDAMTTMIFLGNGIAEGNPMVRWALSFAHAGWLGLILTKMIAAVIGGYCHRSGRVSVLRKANAGYTLVVAWNLVAIATAAMIP